MKNTNFFDSSLRSTTGPVHELKNYTCAVLNARPHADPWPRAGVVGYRCYGRKPTAVETASFGDGRGCRASGRMLRVGLCGKNPPILFRPSRRGIDERAVGRSSEIVVDARPPGPPPSSTADAEEVRSI